MIRSVLTVLIAMTMLGYLMWSMANHKPQPVIWEGYDEQIDR